MANNPAEPPNDDFLEQLFGLPNFPTPEAGLATAANPPHMMLQLSSGDGSGHISSLGAGGAAGGYHHQPMFPLGLSLEQGDGGGFLKPEEASGSGKRSRDEVVDGRASNVKNVSFML